MSDQQLKAFLEKVKGDTSLQEKLEAAVDSDAALAIAKDAGFIISADDLKNAQAELSEEELEEVAGGITATPTCLLLTMFWLEKWNHPASRESSSSAFFLDMGIKILLLS